MVKRSTAISRLGDVADGLTRTRSWPDAGFLELDDALGHVSQADRMPVTRALA